MLVVQDAIRVRRNLGIAASLERTTTGRRETSGTSHHQTRPSRGPRSRRGRGSRMDATSPHSSGLFKRVLGVAASISVPRCWASSGARASSDNAASLSSNRSRRVSASSPLVRGGAYTDSLHAITMRGCATSTVGSCGRRLAGEKRHSALIEADHSPHLISQASKALPRLKFSSVHICAHAGKR